MTTGDIDDAGRLIAKAITDSLAGPDADTLEPDHHRGMNVTGGLFAIATAINRLAEAIESRSE